MSIHFPERDDSRGLINPPLVGQSEDSANQSEFFRSPLIEEEPMGDPNLGSALKSLPPLIGNANLGNGDIQGRALPAANYGKRAEIEGFEEELAKLKDYRVNHDVADVLQDRLKGEDFARQGRYGAAVATDSARLAINMGQYAAGTAGQMAIPVPVAGYQAGVAAYRGILGAAGEAVRAPAVKYENSDEGRIAAAKQRALDYNEQIDDQGNLVQTDWQKRAEATGVRFREQGDDRVVGRTALGTAKGFLPQTWRKIGAGIGAVFNKETWRSAWRATKGGLAKVKDLFGGYRVPQPEGGVKPLSRGKWNKFKRAFGSEDATAAPAREHLDRQRKDLNGSEDRAEKENLEAPASEDMSSIPADEQPAAPVNPDDAIRNELQRRRDAANDDFDADGPFYGGLIGNPLPSVDQANEHEREKVLAQAKAEGGVWLGAYDRHKMNADARTAHMPSWEEHKAMNPAERAETLVLEQANLYRSGKLQRGIDLWKQRQQLLGLEVNGQAVDKDLAGPSQVQDPKKRQEAITERKQAIEFATDAVDYQSRRREMEEYVGPGELPYGYGVTFGKNNLLSRLQNHVNNLQERTDRDAEIDDEGRGGRGARWKALASGIPLATPFEDLQPDQSADGSVAEDQVEVDEPDSQPGLASKALGVLGEGGRAVGDAVVKGRPVRQVGKVTNALGLGGTVVGGAAETVTSTMTSIDGLTGTPFVPLLGAAGQGLSALGGILKTGQAYLNRDVDPETTAPRELAASRSVADAFKGRQELAARARGKVLRGQGRINPYIQNMFKSAVHRAINNVELEKAQTAAGVTTADEKSMLETANFNLDPAKIDSFAAESDREKLKADPRYKLAKEEVAVRELLRLRGAQQQQQSQVAQDQRESEDDNAQEEYSDLLRVRHSVADDQSSDGGLDNPNFTGLDAFADLMKFLIEQSDDVQQPDQPRSRIGESSEVEQQESPVVPQQVVPQQEPLVVPQQEPLVVPQQVVPQQVVPQQEPLVVPQQVVQQRLRRLARGSAPLPQHMHLTEAPAQLQKVPPVMPKQQEDVPPQAEGLHPNELQPLIQPLMQQPLMGQAENDEDAFEGFSENFSERESFVRHEGGIPNVARRSDDTFADEELDVRERVFQRQNGSSDSSSFADPEEMHILDDDDAISIDGRDPRNQRRDSGEMHRVMDDDDAVSMY